MAKKAKKHVHRYHYVPILGSKAWACSLPDCSHYMPKNIEYLVQGRNSICWECGDTFILDEELMKNERPVCRNCNNSIKSARLSEFLASKEV